ncbi:unnamed protein product [Rangifer tarandus platyrhynchus]|uniref:Uncharacterized protein n=2 Tax=Rangifer tarandus platyrhynchus TaxID=3082113 RepID=A0AC59ZCM6_RANTA|nr:unnamed protein product [Rangifer tarandus platyrhynchus]
MSPALSASSASAVYLVTPHKTSPFWGIGASGCPVPSPSVLAPVTSWNMKDCAPRPCSEPVRAETGRASPGATEGREGRSVSPDHHCTLTRVLGTKSCFPEPASSGTSNILMLSPSSFCIKKEKKSKKKKKHTLKPTWRKEVFSFYIDI